MLALGAAAALGASQGAAAFVTFPARMNQRLGLAAPSAGGTLMLAGSLALGYLLLPRQPAREPRIVISRREPGGQVLHEVVDVGGPLGEDQPRLGPAEDLPADGSSQPLSGASGPRPAASSGATPPPVPAVSMASSASTGSTASTAAVLASSPARSASPPAASATGTDSRYLRALALSTMVQLDDRPDAAYGWPAADYCRAGVQALQCHHDDLWLRNRAAVAVRGARVCVPASQRADFRLAGAGSDGCLRVDLPARGDRQVDLQQVGPAGPHYPGFQQLQLRLSLPAWKPGLVLHVLRVPVMAPQTFFPRPGSGARDRRHQIGVQQRRVTLLSKLVVFTYHGSGESLATVGALRLRDPLRGFRILSRARHPRAFDRYHLPECTSDAPRGPGQVHVLASGMSCGVLLASTDIHAPPYAQGARAQASMPRDAPPGPKRRSLQQTESRLGLHPERIDAELRAEFQIAGPEPSASSVEENVSVESDQALMVAGDFTAMGPIGDYDQPMPHLVVIDREHASAPEGLMLNPAGGVRALALTSSGDQLFLGGVLEQPVGTGGEIEEAFLADTEYDDWTLWDPHAGPDGEVLALAASGERMYVGGRFERVAGRYAPGIALLRIPAGEVAQPFTNRWRPVGTGLVVRPRQGPARPGVVRAILATPTERMLIGGTFGVSVQGVGQQDLPAPPQRDFANFVMWSPPMSSWIAAGQVFGGAGASVYASRVNALAVFGDHIIAGGRFSRVGAGGDAGQELRRARGWARLSPPPNPRWEPIHPDLSSDVRALLATPEGLLAGGRFQQGTSGPTRILLSWNAHQLRGLEQPLALRGAAPPQGQAPVVDALASFEQRIYLGGRFSELVDGEQVSNLAWFDPQTGQSHGLFGEGVNGTVHALLPVWAMLVDDAEFNP